MGKVAGSADELAKARSFDSKSNSSEGRWGGTPYREHKGWAAGSTGVVAGPWNTGSPANGEGFSWKGGVRLDLIDGVGEKRVELPYATETSMRITTYVDTCREPSTTCRHDMTGLLHQLRRIRASTASVGVPAGQLGCKLPGKLQAADEKNRPGGLQWNHQPTVKSNKVACGRTSFPGVHDWQQWSRHGVFTHKSLVDTLEGLVVRGIAVKKRRDEVPWGARTVQLQHEE